MHFVKAKGILSAKNGMNLFRGCLHGCIYCDSRSKCYQINHHFEDIEVKENALELLRDSLKRKRSKCMIGTGAMSDPYIPIEEKLQYTRQSLLLAEHYGFGFTLITKSNRVLRDLDVIKRVHQKTKCVIQMTLTTFDESLCKIIEPNVSTTKERFETLKTLNKEGIPTVVWLCPVLPFINDTKENLLGILNYCIEAKVKGIICFGMGLTLREGNREYFYQKLDEHFPGMKERYIRAYGNQYNLNSPHQYELMKLFHHVCEQHGIMHHPKTVFDYLTQFESKENQQLSLFE